MVTGAFFAIFVQKYLSALRLPFQDASCRGVNFLYICSYNINKTSMARLTAFSRLLIVAAIIAGIFFAVRTFMPQLKGLAQKQGATENTNMPSNASERTDDASSTYNPNNNSGGGSSAANANTSSSGSATRQPFTFMPAAPNGGKLRGVVELGATGFNSFIVRMDAAKNWKLEKSDFGVSLIKENMATEEDIKRGLKQYINGMLEYGVGPKEIHFVVSSGAVKEAGTQKIISALKSMGYFVNTVTPEQEAKLAFRAAMPKGYEKRAFVVDIGSGNSKISWMLGGQPSGVETHGSKYFQNGSDAATVYNDVASKARSVPDFARSICFIIGGVPFEMAKKIRNGTERYTVLMAPEDFAAQGEKQKAGQNIYKAVSDATGCKQFVFDWDANFTIGFLLNM